MKKLIFLVILDLALVLGSKPYQEVGTVETEKLSIPDEERQETTKAAKQEEAVENPTEKANEDKDADEKKEQNEKVSHEPDKNSVKESQRAVKKEDKAEKQAKTEDGADSQPPKGTEEQMAEVPESKPQPIPEEVTQPESEPEAAPQPEPVTKQSYNPQNVVNLAIAKCKAGGMVTTTDNLNNLLADGSITQAEYNEYYPYDGLGYYSVFVQTDLNAASTTSGRRLSSEGEIADYIADMLLLEKDPVFNIDYTGGGEFYEFRCYR